LVAGDNSVSLASACTDFVENVIPEISRTPEKYFPDFLRAVKTFWDYFEKPQARKNQKTFSGIIVT